MAKAPKEVKERVLKLRELLNYHRYQYHVLDRQEISDEAYDALEEELVKLEEEFPELVTPESPTQRVSGAPLPEFKKVNHQIPQWSFNDAFTEEDLLAFDERVTRLLGKKPTYTCELKIDGFKIVLTYVRGLLTLAATRGDGRVGEDVTANVRTIRSVPLTLNEVVDVIVEGEIWLSKNRFKEINMERTERGEPTFANPRNVAAGTIRQLDPRIVNERRLDNFIYDLSRANFPLPKTQFEELEKLRELGFKVNPHFKFCADVKEVLRYWQEWQNRGDELDYGLDGVVVKVNEIEYQEKLGYTGKAPRFGVALKFRAEEVTTVVEDIAFQVGRTGIVTPVAHLRPVFLDGSTVSRATLHNEDEIKRLDVRVGDTVIIRKAGDIIPDIVKVLPELRTGKEKPFVFPNYLEACGGAVERIPGQAAHRCVKPDSFAQLRRKFYHFVSKHAFDIDGFGPKLVDQLLNAQLIASYDDIFTLKRGDLLNLPRFAEKSADNLLKAIEASKKISLQRFLVALSIGQVGEETAEDLAEHFKTIENLAEAKLGELTAIPGVGEVVAKSVYDWFRVTENKKLVRNLLKLVKIEKVAEVTTMSKQLAGKTFVLTGTLPNLSRDEAKDEIKKRGGEVSSSVSRNTDYVVAGTDPGSKYDKAQELGVKILSEDEFKKLLKSGKLEP